MKREYRIIVSNGKDTDSFTLKSESKEAARTTAHIAHIGTGWDVVQVKAKK